MVIWVQTWEYTVILYKASSYPENIIYIKKLLFKDFILKIYTDDKCNNEFPTPSLPREYCYDFP